MITRINFLFLTFEKMLVADRIKKNRGKNFEQIHENGDC